LPRLKKYAVFISHAWDHSSDYDRLVSLLKSAKRFDFRNCSIPKTRSLKTQTDRQLERALRNQIRPASSVLIIAGMYVTHRRWIKKEIQIAVEMNKNIIIVKPHGAQKMPSALQLFPHVVGWDTNNIVRSIRNPVRIVSDILDQFEKAESRDNEQKSAPWQEDISNNPDFSALQEWLNNSESPLIESLKRRTKILERRRGVSG